MPDDRVRRDASELIAQLIAEHVEIDRDVVELDHDTWAIHGYIAYEGEVIAATYPNPDEARAELSYLDEIENEGS
jgi:hypothetical protein